jgi:cytochrome oxidase Cu insertion factor (SCO1/SenC/PrrC family)
MRVTGLVVAAFLLCGSLLPAYAMGGKEKPLTGVVNNVLQQSSPAADFTLTDQHGTPFHMADTRGKVVLMTFIYTHCTDICPYIALKVKEAYDLLGADASRVVIVAVTTDPKRDVPAVTAAYSKEIGLLDGWHFVSGPAEVVQAVWANYGIGVTVDPDTAAATPPKGEKMSAITAKKDEAETPTAPDEDAPIQGLSKADVGLAGRIAQAFGGGYDVGHSAPFWFVDKKGRIRIGMDADATPAGIVMNIRVLLKQ